MTAPTQPILTHHFQFDDMLSAYDAFARAVESGARRVVISRAP